MDESDDSDKIKKEKWKQRAIAFREYFPHLPEEICEMIIPWNIPWQELKQNAFPPEDYISKWNDC